MYHYIENLANETPTVPEGSILSRTLFTSGEVKFIVFRFAPGQELSEHTASTPAILHILEGQARLTLGQDPLSAGPGTWVHMEANLAHSLVAETPVTMLLYLLK